MDSLGPPNESAAGDDEKRRECVERIDHQIAEFNHRWFEQQRDLGKRGKGRLKKITKTEEEKAA